MIPLNDQVDIANLALILVILVDEREPAFDLGTRPITLKNLRDLEALRKVYCIT